MIKRLEPVLPDLKSAGYTIELALDLRVQKMAENALRFGYDEIIKRDKDANLSTLNGAMVVVDNQSGEVLALVGGVDSEIQPMLNILCKTLFARESDKFKFLVGS